MVYTVKKLAAISGVSVRTLHYYDEIGLLAPAYTGENNYRYYEQEQLLKLQQILFYRELGLSLSEIQSLLESDDFNALKALEGHKTKLKQELDRHKQLIKTIDKTIAHLKGNEEMKLDEIFHGFNEEKQKLYEDFLVDGGVDQKVIDEAKGKVKSWSKEKWLASKEKGDQIHADLIVAIEEGLTPASPEVQAIIKSHYEFTKQFWTPNKETYIGLSQLYQSHPDFVSFYENLHPKLLPFLMEGMRIFAENELS